jgi:glutamyl-tRNA synthetase
MSGSGYRGRLAPSPTGFLHVGHARTFSIAAQRARSAAGTLILRNEDLDPRRCRPEFVIAMFEDLRWLGITWDEGPDVGGPFAPYSQSERADFYLGAWKRLLDGGFLYPCACSRRDVAQAVAAPNDNDDELLYPGTCRGRSGLGFESPSGLKWRFRVPDGETITFHDRDMGVQSFVAGRHFGDFLVWGGDDLPSYQLAVVTDDAAMHVTEVVRGADLLKSTARQLLLYRALGLKPPEFYHCELVRDQAGQRLAKRHDALSIRTLRERGWSPEQVLGVE